MQYSIQFHVYLKGPVKFIPVAEILAAAEAIGEWKSVAHFVQELLEIKIEIQLRVDSNDLFTILSTQIQSIDLSIRGNVACIRF